MPSDILVLRKKDKSIESNVFKQEHTILPADSEQDAGLDSQLDIQQQEQEIRTVIITPSTLEGSPYDSDYTTSDSDVHLQSTQMEFDNINFDFLDTMTRVPSLDEVSDDSEEQQIIHAAKGVNGVKPGGDKGAFVDPLTGEVIEDTGDSLEFEEYEIKEESVEEETSEMSATDFSEDSDLLVLLEPREKKISITHADVETLEHFFAEIREETQTSIVVVSDETLEREKFHKTVVSETTKFLHTLIYEVVQQAEYTHPNDIIRKNSDKLALMNQIEYQLKELEAAQKLRLYLNRKVIDFHKRKRKYSAIIEEPSSSLSREVEKYKEATRNLDHVLNLENELKEKSERMRIELSEKLDELQQKNNEKEQELESMIYKTLVKKDSEKLREIISALLGKISKHRDEISKVLLDLIQDQGTKAQLEEKINQYENELRIREYELLRTESVDISKKVEERNVELNHLRKRCNNEIHTMSHLKEKSNILRNLVSMKKEVLAQLQQNKKEVREYLVGLKAERTRIQKQIRELTFQSGLLCNPVLLRDYDATLAQAGKMREHVRLLREQRINLINKIAKIEKQCLRKQPDEQLAKENKWFSNY